jgi:hypothetical protein
MILFDTALKSDVIPLEILIFSTSDAFNLHKSVFSADFIASDIQLHNRRWFDRNIRGEEYARVRGEKKIESCLQSLPQTSNAQQFMASWLNKGSPFEEFSLELAASGWHVVLYRMLVERTMDLKSISAEKSDAIFSAFKQLVFLPQERSDAVCKQLDRDWEPYPDPEQRAANIGSKTGWDRDLYENFVLKHDQFYFGSSFQIFLANHYMSNFAAEFVRLTTEAERRDFYAEVYALNVEKDHTPINQLEHPLEALVYPPR